MTDTHDNATSYQDELHRMAEIDRQAEVSVIQVLMSTPSGRRYLWNLMAFCSVFESASTLDHGWLAYNEGRRNVGLKLLHSIHAHAPEAYESMTKESAAISAHLRAVKAAEDALQQSEFS